jgi:hypothetical protein
MRQGIHEVQRVSMASSEFDEQRWAQRASRLRWLVAIQLVLATVYSWTPLIPRLLRWNDAYTSLIWATCGISTAPLTLLAFWCAFGTSSAAQRRIGGLIGVVYLAGCSLLHEWIRESTLHNSLPTFPGDAQRYSSELAEQFVTSAGIIGLCVCLLAGGLLLGRRWLGELQYFDRPDDDGGGTFTRYQFGIRHLVAVTVLVATVCGLSRGAGNGWPAGTRFDFQGWAQQALFLIAFLGITVVAALGTLLPGALRGRVWRAMAMCLAVSCVYAAAMPNGDWSWWRQAWWWILFNGMLLVGLPAGIIIGSLLVVRSCGYRLIKSAPTSL